MSEPTDDTDTPLVIGTDGDQPPPIPTVPDSEWYPPMIGPITLTVSQAGSFTMTCRSDKAMLAKERERVAALVESFVSTDTDWNTSYWNENCRRIAAAIRAMK